MPRHDGSPLARTVRMIERTVSAPEIGLIAATRVALGIGIGLLIGNRLGKEERKAAGLALTLVGAVTTVPLFLEVFGKKPAEKPRVLAA